MTAAIELKNITKTFGQHVVLDDLTFAVEENTICGFLGVNGAGKTTTFRLLNGLISSDSGQISVFGQAVSPQKPSQDLKFLQDVPNFYSYLTASEYLRMICELNHLDSIDSRVKENLALMNLSDAKNRRIGQFSRGMKQRVGLASVVIAEPKILLLDEPVSALDPVGRKATFDLLALLKGQMTILFSTHIIDDVARVADQVVVIHQGKKRLDGSVEALESQLVSRSLSVKFKDRDDLPIFLTAFPKGQKIKDDQVKLTLSALIESENITSNASNQSGQALSALTELQFQIFDFLTCHKILVSSVSLDTPSLEEVFIEEISHENL